MVSYFDTHIGARLLVSLPESSLESSVKQQVSSLLDTISLGFFSCVIASYKVISYHFEVPSEWARGNRELAMISLVFPQTYRIPENRIKKEFTSTVEELLKNNDLYKAFYINDKSKFDDSVRNAQEGLVNNIKPIINVVNTLIQDSPQTKDVEGSFVNLKVVVVGNSAVGKTSLTTRYATGEFRESYISTIGLNFFRKNTRINDREVRVQFWDTAGQERYSALMPTYYRAAHAAVLVYDLTSQESFDKILSWVDQIHKHCPDASICLVGNKNDLESQRLVSQDDGNKLAKKLGCIFFEASAKTDSKVKDMFDSIISMAMNG